MQVPGSPPSGRGVGRGGCRDTETCQRGALLRSCVSKETKRGSRYVRSEGKGVVRSFRAVVFELPAMW